MKHTNTSTSVSILATFLSITYLTSCQPPTQADKDPRQIIRTSAASNKPETINIHNK